MSVSLDLDTVSKNYGHSRVALQDISLHMEAGVWGLVGPNGAGKTTLLRILATLLVPTKGRILWNGADYLRAPILLRRDLGYLPQDFGVYPHLTAREFLCYIGELKGLSGSLLHRRVADVLEATHLLADSDRRLRSFSGGMIRRVGIAQALLSEPRLLIFDEPTVGLDPAERVHFRELIASLEGERLIILSTHIIADVEAMATNMVLLRQGKLCWQGTATQLQDDARSAVWSVKVDPKEFEQLRNTYQISMALRRGQYVDVRLIAPMCPHHEAVAVEPTLEEAYLFFIHDRDEQIQIKSDDVPVS